VNDAEKHFLISRFYLACFLGFALLIANDYLKSRKKMNNVQVIEDVELFLKQARLQNLILPEQQTIIDSLTKAWLNVPYRGPIVPMKVADWLRQTNTLSP